MLQRLGAALFAVLLMSTPSWAQTARAPVRVILVGDSTMQASSGYGGALCARFSAEVDCQNRGRGGRSSKSFRAEGLWDQAMAAARDGQAGKTYVLIQMGHNDGSSIPERHTELPEYKANMARFVDDVRAAGATPVLITLVTDRRFKDGILQASLKPWADLTTEVAREKDVVLIDLFKMSYDAVQVMGATQAAYLAPGAPPPAVIEAARTGNMPAPPARVAAQATPPRPAAAAAPATPPAPAWDHVHLGPSGAALHAGQVAEDLKRQIPELAPYIVATK